MGAGVRHPAAGCRGEYQASGRGPSCRHPHEWRLVQQASRPQIRPAQRSRATGGHSRRGQVRPRQALAARDRPYGDPAVCTGQCTGCGGSAPAEAHAQLCAAAAASATARATIVLPPSPRWGRRRGGPSCGSAPCSAAPLQESCRAIQPGAAGAGLGQAAAQTAHGLRGRAFRPAQQDGRGAASATAAAAMAGAQTAGARAAEAAGAAGRLLGGRSQG